MRTWSRRTSAWRRPSRARRHSSTCDDRSEIDVAPRGSWSSASVRSLASRDRVDFEVPDDAVQVRIRQLQDLVQPVHELDVRIAAHLAEDGGAFDGLVSQAVELAEQCGTTDFAHAAAVPDPRTFHHPGRDRRQVLPTFAYPATSSNQADLEGPASKRAPRRV